MRCFIYLCLAVGMVMHSHASIPNNGVVLTAQSLNHLLDEKDENSPFQKCQNQSRSIRFISNTCTKLIEGLRKRMNMMALEADLQMQAEKISKKPLSTNTLSRIAMLAKINLLATQAEDMIKVAENGSKNSDLKDDLSDILPAVRKVQTAFQTYAGFFPHDTK